MPSVDLAKAIAVAVREYVPPASLSSVAAQETGVAVKAMLEGVEYEHVKIEPAAVSVTTEGQASQVTNVVNGVLNGMEGFVGFDEP